MFRLPLPRLSYDCGLVRQNKKTLEGVWVPEKAGLLSKKAWLQSQLENVPLKNVASMLIKEKDIISFQ